MRVVLSSFLVVPLHPAAETPWQSNIGHGFIESIK